jgi:hypothetical protein
MAFGLVVAVKAGFTAAAVPNSRPVPRILFCLGSDEMKKKAEYPFDGFDGFVHSPPRAMHPNELPAG